MGSGPPKRLPRPAGDDQGGASWHEALDNIGLGGAHFATACTAATDPLLLAQLLCTAQDAYKLIRRHGLQHLVFSPVDIGPVRLDDPVILAPMSGVTDMPFRQMVKRGGAGLVVSEMIASGGDGARDPQDAADGQELAGRVPDVGPARRLRARR